MRRTTPFAVRSSMKLGQRSDLVKSKPTFSLSAKAFLPRLFKTRQSNIHPQTLRSPSKLDRVHIFTIIKKMVEYIRLSYKMIEAYIEHEKTIIYNYIEASYNTPSKRYVIDELCDDGIPQNAQPSKMKPRRAVSGSCAKRLMLGWKENDANVIG
ncbi:hypothetical protein Tco_1132772 [Tanacetum coccineum]|uniref:Transposase n=1 Tax=Tanacetum coccineum TaxID=301880 RepID=A0ABQ5JCW7_9ASTR